MRFTGIGVAEQTMESCSEELQHADFDSKAGREKAAKRAAECAAGAACASYGVPPDLCASVAGEIAGGVIDVWNDVFGNREEWEKYYKGLAADRAWTASFWKVTELHTEIAEALFESAGRVVTLADELLKPGYLGANTSEQAQAPARVALRNDGVYLWTHPTNKQQAIYSPPLMDVWNREVSRASDTAKGVERAYQEVRKMVIAWLEQLRVAEMRVSDAIMAAHAALTAAAAMQDKQSRDRVVAASLVNIAAQKRLVVANAAAAGVHRRNGLVGWGLGLAGAGALFFAWRRGR